MTARKMLFEDGSSIEWADRESLRYEEPDGHVLLVWVDFEPGFFSRGRVLRVESLDQWSAASDQAAQLTDAKRQEIITKVRAYYGNKPLRVSA